MTTITFQIPDEELEAILKMINEKGGTLHIATKAPLSTREQASLNRALDEVRKIESGETRALNFDELWDE